MTDKCKSHGGKPIEFCGDQEGWIAVASLSDDSPLSPCYPSVVLLGMGLGESGKAHPSNIAAMLTIEQATDLRERLTSAMAVDRPAPTPTGDPLATVRTALDVASKATPGPWQHNEVLADGELIRDEVCDADGNIGGAGADFQDTNAAAIVALHNAAPAIAELCAEVERLRRHYDAAGPGPEHNLLALLDLYHEREQAAIAKLAKVEVERDDARAEVERLRGERDKAFDRGRAVGRADVGKYSYAIGQIEGVLGIACAQPLAETVKEVRRLRTENDLLHRREPTIDEMNLALVDRDELSPGDPYPPGWPTIRRCLHCRAPVAGGPTACVSCVTRAENHGLSLTNEAMAKYIEDLTEQLEKPEDVRLREVIAAMEGVKEHLPNLPARIDAVLDELDEMIERAGRAERGWDAAIAAANEARR